MSNSKDIKRQIIKCAAWASSPHQQLMLVPRSDVTAQAKKPRVLDQHAFVDYPSEETSESEESEDDDSEESDEVLDLK